MRTRTNRIIDIMWQRFVFSKYSVFGVSSGDDVPGKKHEQKQLR